MKILLSAYACEPGSGSEEGVGWNMVLQVVKYHETWVLTRKFYQEAIEAELKQHPLPNLHFIYVEPFDWKEDFRGRQGGVQLHYYLWQILAYFQARSRHSQIKFDIAHHVTYVKYWSPSFLSLLPIPFIWGPVGGGEAAPKPFWRDFSKKAKLYETARDIAQRLGELDPFTRMTARRSMMALATTEETAQRLRSLKAKNIKIVSQLGLSQEEINLLSQYSTLPENPIKFICVGRLLHWKGVHLGIRAFAQVKLTNSEYWIVGNGPEMERLKGEVKELGITDRVKFLGNLSRQETLSKMAESHVLVHPSLHDSGGLVCTEMMGVGRPVICLDLGGPGTQITEETGIKVPGINPDQAVEDLADAMQKLASDPDLRSRLGEGAKKRVKEFYDWDLKGEYFAQLYEEIVANFK
jgi:glycosyltransferase involved in cell wall biosynthesis